MTDSNQGKKKRITISATPEGVEIAEKALIRLGFESKSNFAKSNLLARSAVTKFFGRERIQIDTFKKICQELTLDWRVIAGLAEEEPLNRRIAPNILEPSEGVEQIQQPKRQVTITDQQTQQVKAVIVLEGDINSEPNFKLLQSILQEYSGDTIKIRDVEIGSIRLIIEGSPEDIERLLSSLRAGEIKKLDEFPVEDIQILKETDEENRDLNHKWELVQEIVSKGARGRDLSGVDLSRANLSRADLIGSNLSGCDLRKADLSDACLIGADLSEVNLIGSDLRRADLSGADLIEAYLIETYLIEAKLSRADLSGAYLIGTDLSDAKLSQTNLSGADLSRSNLSRANLIRANLSGANLNGAILSEADVKNARFGDNPGISESMKRDLINRGAIFEDFPDDRSPTSTR